MRSIGLILTSIFAYAICGPAQMKTIVTGTRIGVGGFDNGCVRDGHELKEGEEFRKDHIVYRCGSDKMMHPKGCFVDEKDLAPGETFNNYEKNTYHECYSNNGIGYKEHFCGYLNPCQNFPEEEKQKFKPKSTGLKFAWKKVEEVEVPTGDKPSGILPRSPIAWMPPKSKNL